MQFWHCKSQIVLHFHSIYLFVYLGKPVRFCWVFLTEVWIDKGLLIRSQKDLSHWIAKNSFPPWLMNLSRKLVVSLKLSSHLPACSAVGGCRVAFSLLSHELFTPFSCWGKVLGNLSCFCDLLFSSWVPWASPSLLQGIFQLEGNCHTTEPTEVTLTGN